MSAIACTCSADWSLVRHALGLTNVAFAEIIGARVSSAWRYTSHGENHGCMPQSRALLLRAYIDQHKLAPAMKARGLYPWTEPTPTPAIRPAVLCRQCGQDVRSHRHCVGCGFVLGPRHMPEASTPGLCTTCDALYAQRAAREPVAAAMA